VRFDSIAHIDLRSGKKSVHTFAEGGMPGEPVFVPRNANAAEGDGWLIALVYRPGTDKSDFAVFDALDVAKGPIGVASLPRRVPFGFHGNWKPAV
jgi:carotenoid cleavage dioxygenase-like enzyme